MTPILLTLDNECVSQCLKTFKSKPPKNIFTYRKIYLPKRNTPQKDRKCATADLHATFKLGFNYRVQNGTYSEWL